MLICMAGSIVGRSNNNREDMMWLGLCVDLLSPLSQSCSRSADVGLLKSGSVHRGPLWAP